MRSGRPDPDQPPPGWNADVEIRRGHPRLRKYKINSRYSKRYNCVAFAAGDRYNWWWPSEDDYWPVDPIPEASLQAFVNAFATRGYVWCESREREEGFEKVAIYVNAFGR